MIAVNCLTPIDPVEEEERGREEVRAGGLPGRGRQSGSPIATACLVCASPLAVSPRGIGGRQVELLTEVGDGESTAEELLGLELVLLGQPRESLCGGGEAAVRGGGEGRRWRGGVGCSEESGSERERERDREERERDGTRERNGATVEGDWPPRCLDVLRDVEDRLGVGTCSQ